ncbi:MAG: 1-acyl-sn-glycerol-3-phosphate acyltransferase [Marinicaulis sp.]|nr:1-acyl-sn-glycerol-3-phosphate acyltransferase [Marinicaulis sp.]
MTKILRIAFFLLVVRPVLLIILGMNVRGREHLPTKGPAIVVANHNSHLDTLTLLALFPLQDLPRLRPVAAADYFMRNKLLAWFALNIIGIIPLQRGVSKNPLAALEEALDRGDILILFPEGSRGEPEQRADFKRGLAFLAKARPETPVHPVFMYGLGKALPKGSLVLVPFNCDVVAGEPFKWCAETSRFMETLEDRMSALADKGNFRPWS